MLNIFVPDQNQLYALYLHRCGDRGVGKPNKEMLALLDEDDKAWETRITDEARQRGVTMEDLCEIEGDTAERQRERRAITPLAFRRVFKLTSCMERDHVDGAGATARIHVGARGLLAILDVVRELPFLEVLDISNLTSLFLADPYQDEGTRGNDVIVTMCAVAVKHPSLRVIDIRGQPLGALAAHHLLELLRANKRIQEVFYDDGAVPSHLVAAIRKQQEENASIPRKPPILLTEPSEAIRQLPIVDRKTVQEQQFLRRIVEGELGFGDLMTAEEISTFVLHARTMSTTEAVTRSKGLVGDGSHLFLVKSGVLRAAASARSFELRCGDFFGDTYEDILFSQNLLQEVERGVVYAIPLECCQKVREAWAQRVAAHYATLKYNALLQAVDTWMRLRICCCSEPRDFDEDETVISKGDTFKGLFLVTSGIFAVLDATDSQSRVREFTAGDVFGEEALLARRECSSVTVVAVRDEEQGSSSCLVIRGCGARVLVSLLRPVLLTFAATYSLHEELQRVQK
uniref:Cyclic nucleotide-binding domain-containing protein n=1 Tax=Trypanosoma congolense (strain IL3000) TaxID=1068625 RepID=G0URI2_TRYCI|nr:conserved hypothetical protein [Trypanosoma congolense IL3000]